MTHFNHKFEARIVLTLLLLAVGGRVSAQITPGVIADGIPQSAPQVQANLPRYLQARSSEFVDWLADGSLLMATRFGDTRQIHRLRAPSGMREQISFAPNGVNAAQARPYASDAYVYLEPRHGGDTSQIYLQRFATHELTALTDGNHRDGAPLWAHDAKHLAFASNRANGVDVEIYELDTDTATAVPRLLAGGSGDHWRIFDWSLDDKHLLLGRTSSTAAGSSVPALFMVEIASGEITAVNALFGAVAAKGTSTSVAVHAREARFAADGRGLVLLTNQVATGAASASIGRFHRLAYLDLHNQTWRDLSTPTAHEVEAFDQSADGRYIAYTLNENGAHKLMLLDQTHKLDLAVQLPQGVIGNLKFDPGNQRLGFDLQSTRAPADVYVYELETHLLTAWTHSEAGPLNVDNFALPGALSFPTWDHVDGQPRELSALVYRSAHADAPFARPVLIFLCSGGGSQCRPGFDPFLQYLVNELNVVVVAPNVRGSGGYGSNLEQAGMGELRDDAVRDVGSLLVWIDLQRGLDREHVAIIGEGFGAYLALQSLAAYGDRLRGGIAAFPPHGSALGHAAEIRRPLLLVQGLNNPAVPAYEMDGLRARLRSADVEVQSLNATDEGENFARKSDRDAYASAAANFLTRLLR